MHALRIASVLLGLALAVAALPLLLELLMLSLAAALPGRRKAVGAAPDFALAVIVPAHNEEILIANCVRSLVAGGTPGTRVFVVAHNCLDGTAQQAGAAGAEVLVLNDEVGGKGVALDHGFTHALAQGAAGVLVIDADSVVSPGLIAAVAGSLGGGAAALQCRYEVANGQANTRTRLAELAFLGMNVLRARGRSRMGLSCGVVGNGFALSAATLRSVPYTSNSLVEDLEYHLHLIDAGLKVEFVDSATVYGEMPEASAAASSQRARWEGGRILMRRQWSATLARRVLHGQARSLEPLLDLLALPLATEAGLLALVLVSGVAARSPWLLGYGLLGFASIALYVIVAALLGPSPAATLGALAAAPGYVLWKVTLRVQTRRAANGGAWVRTRRNSED